MIKTQRLAAAAVSKVLAEASLTTVLQDTWHNHPESVRTATRGPFKILATACCAFTGNLTQYSAYC